MQIIRINILLILSLAITSIYGQCDRNKIRIDGRSIDDYNNVKCKAGDCDPNTNTLSIEIDTDQRIPLLVERVLDFNCDEDFFDFVTKLQNTKFFSPIQGELHQLRFIKGSESFSAYTQRLIVRANMDDYLHASDITVYKTRDTNGLFGESIIGSDVSIIYSEDFQDNISDIQKDIILLHEFGHVTSLKDHAMSGKEQETMADIFAGRKLAKLYLEGGMTLLDLEEELNQLFEDYEVMSESHPSKAERIDAFKRGWQTVQEIFDQNRQQIDSSYYELLTKYESIAIETPLAAIDSILELLSDNQYEDVSEDLIRISRYRLAKYYFQTKQYQLASNVTQRLITDGIDDVSIKLLAAKSLFYWNGELTKPSEDLFLEILSDPRADENQKYVCSYFLGRGKYNDNEYQEAIVFFERSIEFDKSNTLAYLGLIASKEKLIKNEFNLKEELEIIELSKTSKAIELNQITHKSRLDSIKNFYSNASKRIYYEAAGELRNDQIELAIAYLDSLSDETISEKSTYKLMYAEANFRNENYQTAFSYYDQIESYGFKHLYSGIQSSIDVNTITGIYQSKNISEFGNEFIHYYGGYLLSNTGYCNTFPILKQVESNYPKNSKYANPRFIEKMGDTYNKGANKNKSTKWYIDKLNSNPNKLELACPAIFD